MRDRWATVIDQVRQNEDSKVEYAIRVVTGDPAEKDRLFVGESKSFLVAFVDATTAESTSITTFCNSPTGKDAIRLAAMAVYSTIVRFDTRPVRAEMCRRIFKDVLDMLTEAETRQGKEPE